MKKIKKRILVVDDEPSITRMLKLNLERTNEYEVMVENSPTHAIRAAQEFRPDLILLDVLMHEQDGGELAGYFQADPQFHNIPVVYLTAAATKTEVKMHDGMIGGLPFLAKPVDMPEIISCLKQHLGDSASGIQPRGG